MSSKQAGVRKKTPRVATKSPSTKARVGMRRYLDGSLTGQDLTEFNQELRANPELCQQFGRLLVLDHHLRGLEQAVGARTEAF